MNFLKSLQEYLESNPFFSLERNFDIDLRGFISNKKKDNKDYNEFLKDGRLPKTDDFYNKFIFLNKYLGACDNDEKFIEIIESCFELVKENEDKLLHNYLLHFFSITNQQILLNNLSFFENKFLELLYSKNYIDISSINSLMFSYLVWIYHLEKGANLSVLKQFIKSYRCWTTSFWNDCKLEDKKNYGILIHQIELFHNARDSYLDLEIFSVYDGVVQTYKNVGDIIHSSIFTDFSNKLKERLVNGKRLHKEIIYKQLDDNDKFKIKNILYKIKSYKKPITIEILYDFLFQFDSIQNVRAMIKVLENLNFFTFNQLNEILENILISQINSEAENIYICPLEADGSSSIYQYLASHSDNLNTKYSSKIKFERSINDVLEKSNIEDEIVIIDDCSLSGTQTSNILKELLGIRALEAHHDVHCEKLNENLLLKFRNSKINLSFCVGSDYAKNGLENFIVSQNLSNFKVYIGKYLHMTEPDNPNPGNRIFGCNSLIWDSINERDDLRDFCHKVGYKILGELASKKRWGEDRRVQSSLGYSDLQQVIVFPYSVPKTTLPILWCEHESWKPLFQNT